PRAQPHALPPEIHPPPPRSLLATRAAPMARLAKHPHILGVKDAGAAYVILGHSERRMAYRATSHRVRAKAEAALAAGLIPVVCVGEPEDDRLLGRAEEVVAEQMAESLPAGFSAAGGVVAYEPVWAIGTGRTPTEADISAMHAMMRAKLSAAFPAEGAGLRLLYGGSVKPGNAVAILAIPHVDGALVGGASLVAEDFLAIARAAG
ncbi:MAG: triose-phosphate isomerase, partial [bacterium]